MKTISLTNKNKIPYFAIVDDEDFERVNKCKWQLMTAGTITKSYYAIRMIWTNGIRKSIYLHREVMGAEKGQSIDHIDRNGLNNQKSNLRFATLSQNQWNRKGWGTKTSSKYKGVYWHKKQKMWFIKIGIKKDGKNKVIYLGRSKDEKEASKIYNEAVIKYFGKYALLN